MGEPAGRGGRTRQVPLDEGAAAGCWPRCCGAGELDAADAEIAAALAILRAASPLDTPGALATLAALRLAQGRAAEARAAAEEGLAKYEAMAACGFFRGAFLRLVHAECLAAMGDRAAAGAAIAARARLLAIADRIGEPGYRRSFLEDVPENRRTLELAAQWASGAVPAGSAEQVRLTRGGGERATARAARRPRGADRGPAPIDDAGTFDLGGAEAPRC